MNFAVFPLSLKMVKGDEKFKTLWVLRWNFFSSSFNTEIHFKIIAINVVDSSCLKEKYAILRELGEHRNRTNNLKNSHVFQLYNFSADWLLSIDITLPLFFFIQSQRFFCQLRFLYLLSCTQKKLNQNKK